MLIESQRVTAGRRDSRQQRLPVLVVACAVHRVAEKLLLSLVSIRHSAMVFCVDLNWPYKGASSNCD